jgi:hypothetical protein
MSAKNGHSQREKWIKTKLELSRILGISRPTLDTYSVMPGFPERAANGHFPLSKCREFVNAQLGRNEEKRALEIQRLRDDVARGQLDLMKAADEVMPIEWTKRVLAHQAISFRQIIQASGLTDEQKESLTSQVEQIDCEEFIRQLTLEAGAPGGSNGGEADEN